jgi:hypothetical protein
MIMNIVNVTNLKEKLSHSNPLGIWGKWNKPYSSALWRVEILQSF